MTLFRGMCLLSTIITVPLISFGAFVRLNGAGLACPDWPLCYGRLIPPAGYGIALEVGHRFVAALLGLLLIALVVFSFRSAQLSKYRKITCLALALVILQGIIGGITVLAMLKPISVTAHLIGGNALLTVLVFLTCKAYADKTDQKIKQHKSPESATATPNYPSPRRMILLNLVFFIILFSGGWNSSHYAGYACPAFPLCSVDSAYSFYWDWESGSLAASTAPQVADNSPFIENINQAIHLSHRAVAVVGSLILIFWGALPWLRTQSKFGYSAGVALIGLIGLEILIGISNALFLVPIPLSALHTLIAACITTALAMMLQRTYQLQQR